MRKKESSEVNPKPLTLEDVIDKHFKDDSKVAYFHSSDAHKNIEDDPYLTYKWHGDRIELYLGGSNGEVCVTVTGDAEKLDQLIKIIKN